MTLPTNGVFRCAIDLPVHSEYIVCVYIYIYIYICNEVHKYHMKRWAILYMPPK